MNLVRSAEAATILAGNREPRMACTGLVTSTWPPIWNWDGDESAAIATVNVRETVIESSIYAYCVETGDEF